MAGVYVKGMVMPKDCLDCPLVKRVLNFSYETVYYCGATEKDISDFGEIDEDCPIVPVPDHGDLIDRDALEDTVMLLNFPEECPPDDSEEVMESWGITRNQYKLIDNVLFQMPVVIPAERSEE